MDDDDDDDDDDEVKLKDLKDINKYKYDIFEFKEENGLDSDESDSKKLN